MTDQKWDDNVIIDFSLDNKSRRRSLYYKRPKGSALPVGVKWRCVCSSMNILNDKPQQYCAACGSKLHLQEATEESNQYHTTVVVSHFYPSKRR